MDSDSSSCSCSSGADCVFRFQFGPKQLVGIGFSLAALPLVSGQTLASEFFVVQTCYHLALFLLPLDFHASRRQISSLAGSEGKSFAVPKLQRCLFDGNALGCCSRRRRILIQATTIKVTTSTLDGVPTHESPWNIYSNARGDFVSFAGEYTTILLQGRPCGLGAIIGSVVVIVIIEQQQLVALFLRFHETARPSTLPGIYCCFCDGRIHCRRWVLPFWESSNSNCVYCV